MRIGRIPTAVGLLLPTALASAANPSNDEQYFLELTDRMRLNPQAELRILANINYSTPTPSWNSPKSSEPNVDNALQYFGVEAATLVSQWNALTPVPALAWNSNLSDSATYHANQVILHGHDANPQLHVFPGEPDLGQRFLNAGYNYTSGGENLYAYAYNAFHGHAGFAIDWGPDTNGIQNPPGHRNNIMNATFREAGVSILSEDDPTTTIGPLIINMDFGSRSGNASKRTGSRKRPGPPDARLQKRQPPPVASTGGRPALGQTGATLAAPARLRRVHSLRHAAARHAGH